METKRIIEIELTLSQYFNSDIEKVFEKLNRFLVPVVKSHEFINDGFEFGGDWFTKSFMINTADEFDAIEKANTSAYDLTRAILETIKSNRLDDLPFRISARYVVTQFNDDQTVFYDSFPFVSFTTKDKRPVTSDDREKMIVSLLLSDDL